MYTYTINGLGFQPDMIIGVNYDATYGTGSGQGGAIASFMYDAKDGRSYVVVARSNTAGLYVMPASFVITSTGFTVTSDSATYPFALNEPYRWFAFKRKEQ